MASGQAHVASLLLRLYRFVNHRDPRLITGLFCAFVVVVLELISPHYFFGDDNMQFIFVHMTEIARNLVQGKSLFVQNHIFGGGFDMRDDPAFLSLWNPVVFACSLLTLTHLKFWSIDLLVSIYLLSSGILMAHLLGGLRRLRWLQSSNTVITLLSVSYACSGYSLIIGEAWGNFVANMATLPMFAIGLFHLRFLRGVVWICCAALVGILAGHLDPLCYSVALFSLFSVILAIRQRSPRPLAVFATGVLVALLIASPLLWQGWRGFGTNPRAAGFPASVGAQSSFPLRSVLAGYFLGWFAHWLAQPIRMFDLPLNGSFLLPLSCSAPLWLVAFRRWRHHDWFTRVPLLLTVLAIILVVRPAAMAALIAHLPFFRSFKWPFRELMFVQFFTLLWLAFNVGRLSMRDGAWLMTAGVSIFLLSFASLGRPAFTDAGDRRFLLSGAAERFWDEVRHDMPSGAVLATLGDPNRAFWKWKYPLSMAGANNFPALYSVTSAGGYSFSKPLNSDRTSIPCQPFYGLFPYDALPKLLQTYHTLYVIEVAPISVVRLGTIDALGRFIAPKTINPEAFALASRSQAKLFFLRPDSLDSFPFVGYLTNQPARLTNSPGQHQN